MTQTTNRQALPLKSLADLKRFARQDGAQLTMTRHDFGPKGRLVGTTRKVVRAQTNALVLENLDDPSKGGSWLYLNGAKGFRFNDDGTFDVNLSDGEREPLFTKAMSYVPTYAA